MADEKRATFWVKLVSVFLVVLTGALIIFWKSSNPELSLKAPIIIGIVVLAAGIFAYTRNESFWKRKAEPKEEQVPDEVSEEERHEMLRKVARETFRNNVRVDGGIKCINDKTVNKNHIYAYKVKMNLDDEWFVGIINANYPGRGVTTIEDKKAESEYVINNRMVAKAENPFEEPDVVESEETVDAFGKPVRKTKELTHKEKKKKEEDKVI